MQWNKKTASILAVSSLILGGAGVIGFQVHAQQSVPANPIPQVQTGLSAASEQNSAMPDKDNIQDQKDNGLPESTLERSGTEAKGEAEANENLPGGGHQDQTGGNVDHQFDGVE